MKNNFITKIIGATLAFAMMIGGAVGTNTSKEAKVVDADGNTTIEKTMTEMATANSWVTASGSGTQTCYTSFDLDNNIRISTTGSANCGSYWGSDWRLYQAQNGTFVVTPLNNATISSLTVTFSISNTGCLATSSGTNKTAYFTSGTAKAVSISSATTYYVANTGTKTNGQVKITKIKAVYSISSGGQQGPTALADPNPQYNDSTKKVTWTTDAHATKYQIKVDTAEFEDISITPNPEYDASGLTTGVQHTVQIKAVGDETNYSSTTGSVQFTPTVPFVSKEYALCTSVNDLEAGAKYIFTSGTTGTIQAMSTESNNNNRRVTNVTVNAQTHRITSTQQTLVVELGGTENHWTFETTNYLGTAGYFASSGSSNYLKVAEEAGEATISFTNSYAVIHLGPSTTNDLVRYNSGSTLFSCYASGQSPVYLWKEYKELTGLNVTGAPTKLTGYYDSEEFDPTGITAYEAVYSDSSTKALSANDITWPALSASMNKIKGSYTEFGTTVYTPEYDISVAADSLSTVTLSGTMHQSYYLDSSWDKGSITVTATYASGSSNDVTNEATIAYYSDGAMNNQVATPADLGVGQNQTIYVKATYNAVSNATGYAQTVTVSIEPGSTENNPLTVAAAVEMGNNLADKAQTSKQYYIRGIVSQIEDNKLGQDGNYVFFWLQNGETVEGFEVYNITPAAGCTNYDDMRIGAEVLIKCQIKRFGTIIEVGSAKSLLSITYVAPTLTGISLNKTSLNLAVTEEDDLTVTPTPLGAELGDISWVSSNSNVATVNSEGHVVAVANGTATITASAGGFEATCSVTVSSKVVMKYSGSTTINMTANDNAELVNLDDELFTVDASKGSGNNFPGLNKDGEIRLYAGGSFVLVTIAPQYTISTIEIDFVSGDSYVDVYVGSTEIDANLDGSFSINAQSFKLLGNGGTSKINQVDISYRDATATEKVNRLETRNTLSFSDYHAGENNTFTYDNLAIRFGGLINKDLWDALDTNEHLIQGYGVMISYEDLGGETFESYYNQSKAGKTVEETSNFLFDNDGADEEDDGLIFGKDYYFPLSNEKTHPAEASASQKAGQPEGTYYIWNLYKNVSNANIEKEYTAVAYIRVGNELVFLTQTTASTRSLAHDLIESGVYASDAFGGSLAYLAGL